MKKPRKYLPVLLMALSLCCVQKLHAQKIGTFQHTYGGNSDFHYASSVLALPDKGFLIAGSVINKILMIRTDSLGRQVWAKSFADTGASGLNPNGSAAVDMVLTPEGKVVVCSNTSNFQAIYLFKINLQGSVLWSKTYPAGNKTEATGGLYIINAPGGGYVITGASTILSTNGEAVVIKTDTAGNILWSNIYYNNTGFQGTGMQAATSRNGGYLIAGTSRDTSLGNSVALDGRYLIMKIDKNGKLQWSKVYGGPVQPNHNPAEVSNSIVELPDKSIYICGQGNTSNATLMKMDSSGNLLWSKIYGGSNISNLFFNSALYDSIKKTINISCEFLGTSANTNLRGVVRLDTSGKIIFSKTLGPSYIKRVAYGGKGHDLIHLPTGGFAMVQSDILSAKFGYDFFLIKMDSAANSNKCNSSVFSISPSAYPISYLYSYKDTSISINPGSGCTVANISLNDSLFCDPFVAGFGWKNPCTNQNTQFLDSSYAGAINWKWDFGDPFSPKGSDTSRLKNPVHIYSRPGTYTVKLISSNSNDTDSISKTIVIHQSPPQTKYFDTLICGGNTIKLYATGGDKYLWKPGGYTSDTPKVTLYKTITYVVQAIANNGCITKDTVHITVDNRPDPATVLVATVKSYKETDIRLQKSDSADVKYYVLYKSVNGGAYKELDSFPDLSNANKTYFYADTAVKTDSNIYTYKVSDIDTCGGGLDTSVANSPVLLKGNAGELQSILNWTIYRGSAYDTAEVQRFDTLKHKWATIAYLGKKDSAYTDSSYLKCNISVYYRIATLLKDGYISYSDSVMVTPYETTFKDTPQIITATKSSTSTTNGVVLIKWKSNNFHVWFNQLYYSADGSHYKLLKDSIPVSQDSFVHMGVNTQSESQYYYLVAIDSCPAPSAPSPIHKTITLTVGIGQLRHNLSWTPYVGFKVKSYQVEKFENGNFVIIDSFPGTDTATHYFPAPCNHVEQYRILAVGYNPGEISFSDSMGRKAIDTIPPDAPVLLNATALDNTAVGIAFKSSFAPDTYNFIVQRETDGNWGTAGSVLTTGPGELISYTDSNVNTAKTRLCYTVLARDSCLNVTASDTFCLVSLAGLPKNLSDSLKWTSFKGYKINRYDILRYAGNGTWDTAAKVNGTVIQFLDQPLPCNVAQTYKVEGIENGGTETTLSNSITLVPFDTIKPPAPVIKYATVLNGSQIGLFWHKSVPKVKLYELSIKTGNGKWQVADTVNVDTSFVFNGLKTADSVYDFRIVAIDSCALNRSINSVYHSPAFLSGIPLDDTVKLNWKLYEGFASVKEYYIYQWVNGKWSLADSASGNSDSWVSKTLPCNSSQFYKIAALDNTGTYLAFSDSIQLTPFDTIKPPEPQLYYATIQPDQTVKLSWQWNPKSNVKYFEIWRSTNKAASVLIDTVIYDSIFIDTSVNVKSNVYTYSVIAIDSCNTANRSKPSQTDSLMKLSLYSLYCNPQVLVHWTGYSGASSYNILRSTDGVNFAGISSVNASTNVFTDNSVTVGKQYYYKTEAVDSKSGYVSYSDTIGIIPRLIPLADSAQLVYATVLKSDETNGSIYIQWKRALRNDTNARGYYVYSLNPDNGKYALIKDISDLNDTSYVQENINTIQNTYKYYIITYNVCDVGINSNIHRTVLLKVQNNNLNELLNWINYLGVPVKSYSVYKSVDGGPQNLVNNAGIDSSFSDSDITCHHNFTYQVQAILANGEISFSDSITVKSYDTVRPVTKPINVATVVRTGLKDGRIKIDWSAGMDKNLAGYNVYRSIDGVFWHEISQGFVGLNLTDTGLNTYRQAYYYKIQPFDSCGNTGPFTIYHTTMQLTASAGNGFNQLSWNGYAGWQVRKYIVFKNGVLMDSLANNVFSFKDTSGICNNVYNYLIKAIDFNNDTILSASNTDSARALNHIPPHKVYIKTVTVSKPNKTATITWTPSSSYDVKNYCVYRKSAIDGSMKFIDSTTNTTYTDSSQQIVNPDCYYVFARDNCGNQSDGSNQGCIIILNAKNQPGYNQLTWNSYQEWYDGVQSYNVYKNEDSTGWQLIGTTSSVQVNEYKDNKLGDSTIGFCYQVEAIENPGQYNQLSRSTVECDHQDATVFIPNTFTPYDQDGLNDLFGPIGVYVKNYSMKIYNRWGELLYNTTSGKAWDGTFQGQYVQQGVYIYLITVTDYNNKQSYFKGTITMFE